MLKSILAAGVLVAAFTGVAQADMVRCSYANLNMMHDEAMKLDESTDAGKMAMTKTMDELKMAKEAKMKGDIEECRMHAGMAMDHLHGK